MPESAGLDEAHQAMAIVEAQVGSLIEVLPVALIVATDNGVILRANRAAMDLIGCRSSLVGLRVSQALAAVKRVDVRHRELRQGDEMFYLYVIHEVERQAG